jgi:hypothetical protein
MTVETAPAQRLAEIVAHLANEIGPRNIHYYTALRSAADYIEAAFSELGYRPVRQSYQARGKTFDNIIMERRGHMFRNFLAREVPARKGRAFSGVTALLYRSSSPAVIVSFAKGAFGRFVTTQTLMHTS